MAKKNKGTITIGFKEDGKKDIIPGKFWDDYTVYRQMFVIKKKGVWLYWYNMDDISYINVDLGKKKKK